MRKDTPANSAHYHQPLTRVVDRVALAMAEGDTELTWPSGRPRPPRPASGADIAEQLGMEPSYVRSTIARIKRQLGPQAI